MATDSLQCAPSPGGMERRPRAGAGLRTAPWSLGCTPHPAHLPEHGGHSGSPDPGSMLPQGPPHACFWQGWARREGGHVCFVQGSPGPMWLCRKLPEIRRNCRRPLFWGGGRQGGGRCQFGLFCPGRCLPPLPLASLRRPQLSPTRLAPQCLRPGGRPHPSTSALSNQRAKGHPRAPSWAAHPRTLAPGGR